MASRTAHWVLGATLAWLVVFAAVEPMNAAVHGDGYYTWLWARSIVFDRDVDFESDYQLCHDPWNLAHTPQGDYINQWNPGPSLFWIPILLFDIATHHPALDSPDPRVARGCTGPLPERAVHGSLVAGFLTIVLAYLVARRMSSERVALFAAVAIGVATPLTYYATTLLSYGHAASACTGGLAVWVWDSQRRRPTRWGWVWMGAATGLAMLTRPQNGVLAILPLCLWLERAWAHVEERDHRRLAEHVGWGFAYVGAALVVFAPQMLQWWDSYGEIFFLPQGRQYMRWGSPRLVPILFSTSNGLLVWNPVLYLAIGGLVLLAWRKRTRSLGLPLLLLFLATWYVNACVYDWWGAIGYPGRRFDSVSVPFAVGIAASASAFVRLARRRRALATGALATAAIVLLGAWTTGTNLAVATASRIDLAHRSDRMWTDIWGRVAKPVWQAIGNPLALPASIPFAIRYRVPPRMWDFAGAQELFIHDWLTLRRRPEDGTFDFIDRHSELLVGFDDEPRSIQGRRVRGLRGQYARFLMPISWPEIGALRFSVAREPDATEPAHVWLEIDGQDLGSHRVDPGQRELTVPVGGMHQGIVHVRMRVVGGWVGFGSMEILDVEPTPQEREESHLRELSERRRRWRAQRRGGSEATP